MDELILHDNKKQFAILLMEHPLRIQALQSQIRVGIWGRNGREVVAERTAYESVYFRFHSSPSTSLKTSINVNTFCRDTFKDLDLFILQCCAIMLGPEEFVEIAMSKFEIFDLVTSNLDRIWTDTGNEPFFSSSFFRNQQFVQKRNY